MDRNNLSQNSNSNFYSQVSSSNNSNPKCSVSSVDRVFNYLEGHQQESNLLGKRLHEQQQQQKRYISQISTYETRIKRYEKTITKKDEEQQILKGKLHSNEHHIQSLEFERKKLSEANAKLEMDIELMKQKVKTTNDKWFEVGANISKKVATYLKDFDFKKCVNQLDLEQTSPKHLLQISPKMDVEGSEIKRRNSSEKNKIDESNVIKLNSDKDSDDQNNKDSITPVNTDQNINQNMTNQDDENRNIGDELPTTFNEMKSKYLELKSRYDKLFKHYSELSEEYAVLMHHYDNGVNTHDLEKINDDQKMITEHDERKTNAKINLSTNASNDEIICG